MNLDVINTIRDLTQAEMFASQDNVFRETTKQLRHIFGNLYYLDDSQGRVKIHCVYGGQDRVVGTDKKEATTLLPYISVKDSGLEPDETRRRIGGLLVSEKEWDPKTRRAVRVLSLSPVPVILRYDIGIWTKYAKHMDMIRSSIHSMFNPDLTVKTSYSDYTRAYIDSESDAGNSEANDTEDRLLKKIISIKVETYIPNPRFLYTNTGEIKAFKAGVSVFDQSQDMENDTPVAVEFTREKLS